MNLIVELPPRDDLEASGRMIKAFQRLMLCAESANDVFCIAPEKNAYWPQLETWFVRQGYHTTIHSWCALGICDSGTGKSVGHSTRIVTRRSLSPQTCQCGRPSSHIHAMRKERKAVEYENCERAHHIQKRTYIGPYNL